MPPTKITTPKCTILTVEVPENCYRPTLIINKNLTNRYGKLEYTERKNGCEHSKRLDNIEDLEIIGFMTKITEEQAANIVNRTIAHPEEFDVGDIVSILHHSKYIDALKSLLKANGVDTSKEVLIIKVK